MKIKELQKTVNIAWSSLPQTPIYLAAGTAAQQFDSNANSTLEIYSTNLSDPSYDLELKATLPSQFRFQKLIWSPTGYDTTHRNGLIVGGCEGGHIMIFSANKMLANEESLLAHQSKHNGAVTGLDFNPFQTNLLASCASESEVFIWDLNNTTTQMNPGAKTQPLEDVQNVAWNRQVQHILASVFSSRCVIWDLRKSEQIIKLSDTQSRVRWHAIQWHPDAATQVWLASEDDQSPVVQLWDLRYATAPAKTMQIHQRGVLGMSWCPNDTDLMVSCGKDNRIYCWNPNTDISEGEILSEVATTATWYSDVQWCPRNPALVASSSLDGNVSIYSLFGGTQQQVQTANKIADSFPGMDQFAQAPTPQQSTQILYHDPKRAPKWIKRPCGVVFGFGGKLVSFNSKSKSISLSQVTTEPKIVERANALEHILNEGNFVDYCRQRADQMSDQKGRYLWFFIKANFESNPKEELLNLLGYNGEDVDNKFSKYAKNDEHDVIDQLSNRISTLTHSDSSEIECDHSTDGSSDLTPVDNTTTLLDDVSDQKSVTQFKIPTGEHPDSLITEALLTGNLEAAVELCLETQRTSEALIIASTAGIEFLQRIQNRILMTKQHSDLSNVISALVTRNWLDFVNRCTIDSWKEALVATLKHGDRKIIDICERLGDRLISERPASIECTHNAMLCYLCAGSIDKLVTAWYQFKQLQKQNAHYKLNTVELQELAEVVMLLSKSLEQQGIALELNERFAEFVSEYGGLLVSQGALSAALAYILALGTNHQMHPKVNALRERIYNTLNYKKPMDVRVASKRQQQESQHNTYGRLNNQRGPISAAYAGTPSDTVANNPFSNTWTTPLQPPTVAGTNAVNTNETLAQPARPSSAASSQGGQTTAGGGLHSRSKYVLDPSVAAPAMVYGTSYNPQPPLVPSVPMTQPNNFNTNPFNPNLPMGGNNMPVPAVQNPMQSTMPIPFGGSAGNAYLPGVVPVDTSLQYSMSSPPIQQQQPIPSQQQRSMLHNPTPPPGWNDPPVLKSARTQKKSETASVAAPITHPLFGVDPNKNQNGYLDPNAVIYQNTTITGGIQDGMQPLPPPPPSSSSSSLATSLVSANANYGGYTQQKVPAAGGYMNSPLPSLVSNSQNNNPVMMQPLPQQTNFHTSPHPSQQQQQQQHTQLWNMQPNNFGYNEQSAPLERPQARHVEAPKQKLPLPEQYIYLQTVLDELKNHTSAVATDPKTKRKFVDITKRLENLYDCLRDERLTTATIESLNQIVQYIQVGDYGNALNTHTQIAFGTDFSQCSGFMPGLKVLIQIANDLQVFVR